MYCTVVHMTMYMTVSYNGSMIWCMIVWYAYGVWWYGCMVVWVYGGTGVWWYGDMVVYPEPVSWPDMGASGDGVQY